MSASDPPDPATFVTQLLNVLNDAPAAPGHGHSPLSDRHSHDAGAKPSNPLENVPEAVKKQFLTLHVLFPNELLPALDLLDRGLVTKVNISDRDVEHEDVVGYGTGKVHGETSISSLAAHTPSHGERPDMQTSDHVPATTPSTAANPPNTIYHVRSAQPPPRPSRFHADHSTGSTHSILSAQASYQVRLSAWHCTCPAFAFASFPPSHADDAVSSSTAASNLPCHPFSFFVAPPPPRSMPASCTSTSTSTTATATAAQRRQRTRTFGGLARLASDPAMPPVCKHLLACVLAERCGNLFGSYVEEKQIGASEAAGWAAGWGDG